MDDTKKLFLGFNQVSLEKFKTISDADKIGKLWFVRDFVKNEYGGFVVDEKGNKIAKSSQIYFGTRLYAETNNVSEIEDLTNKVKQLTEALGGFDEEGTWNGFLPLQSVDLGDNVDNVANIIDAFDQAIFELQGQVASAETRIDNVETRINEVEAALDTAGKVQDILVNGESIINENGIANIEIDLSEVDTKLSGLTETVDGLKTDVDALVDEVAEVEDKVSGNTAAIVELEKELNEKATKDDIEDVNNEIEYIKGQMTGLWHFKGIKDSFDELNEVSGATEGDVYTVGDDEYAWDGEKWVKLGGEFDLSNYYDKDAVDDKFDNVSSQISGLTEDVNTIKETLVSVIDEKAEKDELEGVKEEVKEVKESIEELEKISTAVVDTYNDALAMSGVTPGQIIYVKNTTNGEDSGTTYTSGAYLVTETTSEGTPVLMKLESSSAGNVTVDELINDLTNRIIELKREVKELQDDTTHIIGGDDIEN